MSEKNQRFHNWKNTKFASVAWVLCILIVVIAVIINMIIAKVDFNWDLSSNKRYSLSDTTEEYLNDLDAQGITIDMYLLCKMDELEEDTESLVLYRALVAYSAHSCINLIDFDPNNDEETMEKLNPNNAYNLTTGDIILMYGDLERRLPASAMYITYVDDDGNETGEEDFNGENLISSSIKALAENFNPTVYFLTGHGEGDIADYTTFTNNLTNYNYDAETLDLSTVDAVPDDTALILVCGPTSDLSDEETTKLNKYLDDGGNITLLLAPNEAEIAYTNFDSIMSDYGFTDEYDRVYETDASCIYDDDKYQVIGNLYELEEDSEAADMTSSLVDEGLVTIMPESRSFAYDDNNGRLTIEPLIVTNDTAVGEAYGGVSDDPANINGECMLAAYSQYNARSNDEGVSSKMVVFGTDVFLDDDHATDEAYIIPVYLLLSTISWMYNTDLDMGIDVTSTEQDYISLQNETFSKELMAAYIIIPIVIMTVGVVVWVKRRNS